MFSFDLFVFLASEIAFVFLSLSFTLLLRPALALSLSLLLSLLLSSLLALLASIGMLLECVRDLEILFYRSLWCVHLGLRWRREEKTRANDSLLISMHRLSLRSRG